MKVDKRLVLIALNGDRLYPYKKKQISTGRHGFSMTKPGEQDRHWGGEYTDSIEEVIRRVVRDGWGVRATTIDRNGRQRNGTYRLTGHSIRGYEVADELSHLT